MIFAQSYKNLSYLQKKKGNFSSFIKEKQYLCTLINPKYDMPQSLHIAIIGGGAAGFFAAIEAKRNFPHADITIFDYSGPDSELCGANGGIIAAWAAAYDDQLILIHFISSSINCLISANMVSSSDAEAKERACEREVASNLQPVINGGMDAIKLPSIASE